MTHGVKGGEFRYYWQNNGERPSNYVQVNDFNCRFDFNRCEGEKYNFASLFNGEMTAKFIRTDDNQNNSVPIFSGDERFVLENIFNSDGNLKDFSKNDFNSLMTKIGKITKVNTKYAYKVLASDAEKDAGKVTVELRSINADGSTRATGRTITIDIETNEEARLEEEKRLDEAYKEKHWFRNFIGITREDYEKENERDY